MLAIPAVYLLASELAGRRVGLLAAALYSIAQWPVAIARVGLRFPYGPLPGEPAQLHIRDLAFR